jgi:mannose-6-phosphate isomerase-like protein (cupin superfamily)
MENIEKRPWGTFETLLTNEIEGSLTDDQFKVKKIVVYPNKKLSLQYHHHRSEHWVITKGSIIAQVGEDFFPLNRNQSIFIPKGVKHRIINDSNEVAELVEVQIGDCVAESDIVRLEDDYGRTK